MAADQVVGLRLDLDAADLRKELAASGKAADELAGDMAGMGGKIERLMAGIVDSAANVEQGIRGVDSRLEMLTGADREVFLTANIGQAQQALRQLDQMLTDPTLTDPEIRIVIDQRNQVSAQIDKLKSEMGELEEAVSDVGEEGERSFGALAGAIGSAGAASRIDEVVTSSGKLRAQLGLTGDAAREFDAIAKEVYRDNFGESMGEAAQVTGQVHQSLRLTGEELQTNTEGVFAIRDAFEHLGADVDTTLNATRTLSANFDNLDPAGALDLIARGFQSGAGRAGDLIDVLQEYPGDFARIGLSAEDMVGIINAGLDAGAWNADRVGDAIREMGIRISTAGDLGQQAMFDLFPPGEAQRLIDDFNRGGEAGREAFFTIIDAINATADPNERYNAQVAIMGTLGEELANQFPAFAEGLRGVGEGAEAAGTGVEGLNEQYSGFRNTLDGLLRTLETSALGTLGDVGLGFADVASNVGIAVLGLKGMKDALPGTAGKLKGIGLGLGVIAGSAAGLYLVKQGLDAMGVSAQGLELDVVGAAEATGEELAREFAKLEQFDGKEARTAFQQIAAESYTTAVKIRDGMAAAGQDTSAYDAILDGVVTRQRVAGEDADAMAQALGDAGGQIQEEAIPPLEQLEQAIADVNDALHAQFDPLFAAQDALLANAEAQEEVARAELELLAAQEELNRAVAEHGPKSDEARDANMRLLGAMERVDRANRDATRSALDVTTATNELAAKMRDGSIDIFAAEEQLRKWVEQGLITEQQAWETAQQLRGVGDRARELEGRSIDIPVRANTTEFEQRMADLYAGWGSAPGIRISVGGGGGLTLSAGGVVPGPDGAGDIVPAMLSPGEFVVRADAASAIGYDALHALNRGEPAPTTYMAAPSAPAPVVVQSGGGDRKVTQNFYRADQMDAATVGAVVAWELA